MLVAQLANKVDSAVEAAEREPLGVMVQVCIRFALGGASQP